MRLLLMLAALLVAACVPLIAFGVVDGAWSIAERNGDLTGLLGLSFALYLLSHLIGDRP